MRYLSIKNFAKHQHYKDRRPPWIKLHVEVLDDYHFACLQDASKAHLMLLWVLASKMDNRIPYDLSFLARKLGTTSPIDVDDLVSQGFIEVTQDDSAVLAPRKRSAMPETEGEAETESAVRVKPPKPRPALPGWVAEGVALWADIVGTVKPAEFHREIQPIVHRHDWPAVRLDLGKWLRDRVAIGKPCKPAWYAGEATARLKPKPPMLNPDGTLTEYGERMSRPEKVPA